MSQPIYDKWISQHVPGGQLPAGMPSQWPPTCDKVDANATLRALRAVGGTLNDGLLMVGWGDGSAIDFVSRDRVMSGKHIGIVVLPEERAAFAHCAGKEMFEEIGKRCKMRIIFPADDHELKLQTNSVLFTNHQEIARLAGTSIVADHPLTPAAEARRQAWMPLFQQTLSERFDTLGNDVYDTFTGAVQAIGQGPSIWQRRASDIRGRWQGKSALCIASGPSARQHFDRIRDIQDEHLIICADSLLPGLLAHGIQPDLICMVERPPEMKRLFEDLPCEPTGHLLAPPWIHPGSAERFGERVIWWWAPDHLYQWLDPQEPRFTTGRSSGTLTVAAAGLCGVKEAWLVGHDLCFAADGSSHAASTSPMAFETQERLNKVLSRTHPNMHRRIMDVATNGGGSAETMGVWNIFRSDIEGLIALHPQTRFYNVNIADQVGAVIGGSLDGQLPEPCGSALVKDWPEWRDRASGLAEYRERALGLLDDMDAIADCCGEIAGDLGSWLPLRINDQDVRDVATKLDITKMGDARNAVFFLYIFRAALHNLMLRLHMNTFVGTMPERNWNQTLVMLMYANTMKSLVKRLRPELEKALEVLR